MKVIAKNRRASFDYSLTETLLAGVVLQGHEVKSVRGGDVSLAGSFAHIKDGELWLINCHIGPYKYAELSNYEPTTTRKLLVHKEQLKKLQTAKLNGMHIVPKAIGLQGRFIKLELGIGRSAKRQDKRQNIQKRDTDRDTERAFKHGN